MGVAGITWVNPYPTVPAQPDPQKPIYYVWAGNPVGLLTPSSPYNAGLVAAVQAAAADGDPGPHQAEIRTMPANPQTQAASNPFANALAISNALNAKTGTGSSGQTIQVTDPAWAARAQLGDDTAWDVQHYQGQADPLKRAYFTDPTVAQNFVQNYQPGISHTIFGRLIGSGASALAASWDEATGQATAAENASANAIAAADSLTSGYGGVSEEQTTAIDQAATQAGQAALWLGSAVKAIAGVAGIPDPFNPQTSVPQYGPPVPAPGGPGPQPSQQQQQQQQQGGSSTLLIIAAAAAAAYFLL